MISPSNTYEGLTRTSASEPLYPDGVRSYARVVALNSAQGAASAQLAKDLGARRAVVLHQDLRDDYVRTLAEEFDTTARTLGLETVRVPWPVRKSYSKLAASVAAVQPDIVYLAGLTQDNAKTAPVFLSGLQGGGTGQQYGVQAALAMILILPPAIFGLLINRYLVRGLTFGAIKR